MKTPQKVKLVKISKSQIKPELKMKIKPKIKIKPDIEINFSNQNPKSLLTNFFFVCV